MLSFTTSLLFDVQELFHVSVESQVEHSCFIQTNTNNSAISDDF